MLDGETLEEISSIEGERPIQQAIFSPDSKKLAIVSYDNLIQIISVENSEPLISFEADTETIFQIEYSPDGKFIALAGNDNRIQLWAPDEEKVLRIFEGHTNRVNDLVFSPDGKTLVSVSDDKTIRLWDVNTGEVTEPFGLQNAELKCVAYSPDGRFLASGEPARINLWNLDDYSLFRSFIVEPQISQQFSIDYNISFSSGSEFLASGFGELGFHIYRLANGAELDLTTINAFEESNVILSFSPIPNEKTCCFI